jgi:predicted RNA-binding Zn-ribbon protein involved in translation (DUF1610 family)
MESQVCPNCGGIMEKGHLASPGEMAVIWAMKTGILRAKTAKVFAYRCSNCGIVQLLTELDNVDTK